MLFSEDFEGSSCLRAGIQTQVSATLAWQVTCHCVDETQGLASEAVDGTQFGFDEWSFPSSVFNDIFPLGLFGMVIVDPGLPGAMELR